MSSKNIALAREDYDSLLETICCHRFWKPVCLTIMNTGIRISELLALKWSDIDLDNKIIKVSKYVFPLGNQVVDYKTPSANRELPLSDSAAEVLAEYKKHREREQKRNRCSYTAEGDWAFGNDESGLRSYSGISHNFRKYLRRQGLGDLNITLKSLRLNQREQDKAAKASVKQGGFEM